VLECQVADLAPLGVSGDVLVVDASSGRLDHVRTAHPSVRWIDFAPPPGSRVTIARQRNLGVRESGADVIVFTDSGATPHDGWLRRLVLEIDGGEAVVAGATRSVDTSHLLYRGLSSAAAPDYVEECPTVNLALRRDALDRVGGFDESFRYGSDVDLSWRLRDAGYRIRRDAGAVIDVDWGDWRRQLRRSFAYGRARSDLYRKHPRRLRTVLRDDPVVVVWPLFLLGLPIAVKRPAYLLLLAVPAWRNRHDGPVQVIVDHAVYGAGVLRGLVPR